MQEAPCSLSGGSIYWGNIGIIENEMETTIAYWVYVISSLLRLQFFRLMSLSLKPKPHKPRRDL